MRSFMARAREQVFSVQAVALGAALSYGGIALWYLAHLGQWGAGTDFFLRWQEIGYVFRGIDPRDVLRGLITAAPDLGVPGATYAPWSYMLGALFVPPVRQPAAFIVFLAWNAIALCAVAMWAIRMWPRTNGWSWWAGAAGILGTIAIPVTLRHLNYSVLVAGAISGYLLLERAGRPMLAGVALALSMVKPQLAALFFLVPLVRREWLTFSSATALVIASWGATSWLVGKGPIRLLVEMFNEGAGYGNAYLGLFNFLLGFGVSRSAVVLVGFGLLGSACAVTLRSWCARPTWALVAAVSAFVLSWSYHRTCDHLLLGFLVIASGRLALDIGGRQSGLVFGVLGATYWFPYFVRLNSIPIVPELFRLTWLAGAFYVLALAPNERRNGGTRRSVHC